jgi:hypothetical protein
VVKKKFASKDGGQRRNHARADASIDRHQHDDEQIQQQDALQREMAAERHQGDRERRQANDDQPKPGPQPGATRR